MESVGKQSGMVLSASPAANVAKNDRSRGYVFLASTLTGVMLGVGLGFLFKTRRDNYSCREAMYIKFVGTLFLQMLESIVIPLVVPTLILTVGSLDLSLAGKIGRRCLVFYMATTILAVLQAIVLAMLLQPGNTTINISPNINSCSSFANPMSSNTNNNTDPYFTRTVDALLDKTRNLFPPNVLQAGMFQMSTISVHLGNATDVPEVRWIPSTNYLGLIVFSLVFGLAIAAVGEEDAKPTLDLLQSIVKIMMQVTNWVVSLAPVGVIFLVAGQIVEANNVAETVQSLSRYLGTVMLGFFVHSVIVVPTIYGIMTHTLPFRYMANMGNAMATAFATASSLATFPVTIESLENKNNIDKRITRFIVPIGATINMDGAALLQTLAVLFISQIRRQVLSAGEMVALSISSTAASIGTAGVPHAHIVTMIMVLETVGLPVTDVTLIMAVDWLLDRFGTCVNVMGDAMCAGIVHNMSKKALEDMDQANIQQSESTSSRQSSMPPTPSTLSTEDVYVTAL